MTSKQIATILITLSGLVGGFFAKDKIMFFVAANINGNQTVTITPSVTPTPAAANDTAPPPQKIAARQEVDSSSDFIVKFKNGVERK